jgi:spore coat polysaccharide biosynthesis predicted glycosyltransferase SpsG
MTNISIQAEILGHNVKVLADGSKYFSSKFDKNLKFEIHRFDQLKFLRKMIKSNFAINLIKENKFDLIFFDNWKSLEGFNEKIKLKKICLIHGSEILEQKKK